MSVVLQYETSTLVLPNPQDGDTEACDASIKSHVAMTGITRTYRRSGGFRRISYTFAVPNTYVAQVRTFLANIIGEWFILRNYRNQTWNVMLSTNPIIFTEYSRTKTAFTIEFLGARL